MWTRVSCVISLSIRTYKSLRYTIGAIFACTNRRSSANSTWNGLAIMFDVKIQTIGFPIEIGIKPFAFNLQPAIGTGHLVVTFVWFPFPIWDLWCRNDATHGMQLHQLKISRIVNKVIAAAIQASCNVSHNRMNY